MRNFRCEGSLKTTSELLGLDIDELRRALTARVMQAIKVPIFIFKKKAFIGRFFAVIVSSYEKY